MSGLGAFMQEVLVHPLARGLDIDSPAFRMVSRRIIREKKFLRRIYEEWYALLSEALPAGEGTVLEIGSGSGFCADAIPGVLSSDIVPMQGVDLVFDACGSFPFGDAELKAIILVNSFHHLPSPSAFLHESSRCLRIGGAILMIEPWSTPWSRLVYTRLHHEPFDTNAATWEFQPSGPLSSANGAMPWIIFERDRMLFEKRFPEMVINTIKPFMPFRYLLSGGVSLRSLMPGWSFGFWKALEDVSSWPAMFSMIRIERR